MSDRKIKVESMVPYTIVLTEPHTGFSRSFEKDAQSYLIPFETMEEGLQEAGFSLYFREGRLKITEKQDRIDLGLEAAEEEAEDDQIEEIFTISTGEIIKLFKSNDAAAIEDAVSKASETVLDNMVKTAIKFKLTNNSVLTALQKHYKGADIYDLLKLSNDAEKPEPTVE